MLNSQTFQVIPCRIVLNMKNSGKHMQNSGKHENIII